MKTILRYIRIYFKEVDKGILMIVTALTAGLIFLNFQFGLEKWLMNELPLSYPEFLGHYLLFLFAFIVPYLFYPLFKKKKYFKYSLFIFFILLAPAIFALKMSADISFLFSENIDWNDYWNKIIYWPLRLIMIGFILFILWKSFQK
ncbi:MAG: hypothetical protein M3O67_00245, partial [Bacteroidota bacterium]|nr:hypothetical protein [Bacteroidota bacterium]